MSFAHPLALSLLLLLIPIALLYWIRLHVPRAVVGAALFWQKALAEEPRRARWQRWRTPVSIALQSLTVIFFALAAASPEIPAVQRIVLVLDNSATMRATDVKPSRFDAAQQAARRMIASLRWCDEMAIVTTTPEPQELQSLTSDRRFLRSAVESVMVQSAPPAIGSAVRLAEKIRGQLSPRLRTSTRILLITDGSAKVASREAQKSGVEVLRVGTAVDNRAITGFAARRSQVKPAECEVFVEVQNRGEQTAQGNVALSVDDKPGPTAPFAIEKDGRWQHVFSLDLPVAARVTAAITPPDAYPFDDSAELRLPAAPAALRVKLIADDRSPLKEIVSSVPRVQVLNDDAGARAIRIIDGKTPRTLPPGPLLIFTPTPCDLWHLGGSVANPLISRVDETSPVMAGVRLFDAYLPEARELQVVDSPGATAMPILFAGTIPLGYAIDRPQGRIVVICGNLAMSNLALQADFPKLIARALDWLDGREPWKDQVVGRAAGNGVIADLRTPTDIGNDVSTIQVASPRLPLWIPLAAAAAVLVVIEWCLYQRRWTS